MKPLEDRSLPRPPLTVTRAGPEQPWIKVFKEKNEALGLGPSEVISEALEEEPEVIGVWSQRRAGP